ncbi:hypothetical protein AKJ16_DCAP20978 [Drosera capensis]
MSVALTNLSSWLWRGKQKDAKLKNGSTLNSWNDSNTWELDVVKFPQIIGSNVPKSRRVSRKCQTREEQKIDKEYDAVLVPSDGGCISDSDSDGSDWSVGWSEAHASGFQSDGENDGGFAVLVPCYGRGRTKVTPNENKKDVILHIAGHRSDDGKKYVEQWLSSFPKN